MQVILAVTGQAEGQDDLLAAADRLANLSGGGRVITLGPFAAGVQPEAADLAAEVETRGNRADFLVVAQPAPQDDRHARRAFRTALFRTQRPVLMVPPGCGSAAFGQVVAIAWQEDARGTRVLMPALRLLANAREVHLLAGVHAGKPTPAVPPILREHGVAAKLHVLTIGAGPFGEILLNRTRELKADLLVMGAREHSHLHDMLLGGVTHFVVTHADMPVLLRN
jgi:nucleotide-binding universal stress UspA family protein